MPWYDYAGRFAPVRLIVLVLLCLPAALVAMRYAEGALGPRQLNASLHEVGNWTLRLLLLSLAVRPLRHMLDWPLLMQLRRMIGVTAFVYAVAHLLLYAADEAFDLQKVAVEIAVRVYLTIGFAALLVLLAMAATSTDAMARRLGARRWQALHRLVYGAALLGVIHFFMQVKADVDEPWVMAGLFAWLMGWRLTGWVAGTRRQGRGRRRGVPPAWAVLALAPTAAAVTALGEALYYFIKLHAPLERVLMVNVTFDSGWRPAAVVLAICLGATATGGAVRAVRRFARIAAP